MSRKRMSQPTNEEINALPDVIKDTLSPDGVIQLVSNLKEKTGIDDAPLGEVTYTGNKRISGYNSGLNVYNKTGFYNTSDIPYNVLDSMRRDYQISLGMSIVKYPIVNLGYTVECKNLIIEKFIKEAIAPIWSDFLRDSLLSLDYGFVAFEKVWEKTVMSIDPGVNKHKIKDRPFIIIKKIKPIHPKTLSIRVDKLGNFIGISQDNMSGDEVVLDKQKSMLLTYQEEYGNYFGRSRMVPAYEAWYWKMISIQFFLRWMERHSIPPIKVSYPKGFTRVNDEGTISNADLALKFAKSISAYGNTTMPSDRDENGHLKWDVQSIEQSKQNLTLDKIVGVWDASILRGLLIPDKNSINALDPETITAIFLSTLGDQVLNIQTKFNENIVKPLVEWNFTKREIEPCSLNIDDIDFTKRQETRKLLSKIMDLTSTFVKQKGAVPYKTFPDVSKIYEILDIPSKDLELYDPTTVDASGKEVKNKEVKKTTGPDEGEVTSGNQSRTNRKGNPRDEDKDYESNL